MLEDSLINYKRGHISLEAVLVIIEAFYSAKNKTEKQEKIVGEFIYDFEKGTETYISHLPNQSTNDK